jgi:hypothetical protein
MESDVPAHCAALYSCYREYVFRFRSEYFSLRAIERKDRFYVVGFLRIFGGLIGMSLHSLVLRFYVLNLMKKNVPCRLAADFN